MHERQQEEEAEDIYHVIHDFPLLNKKGELLVEPGHISFEVNEDMNENMGSACNNILTENSQLPVYHELSKTNSSQANVAFRRGPRHRKAANVSRSSSLANVGRELHGRRPLSMSCLVATNLTNPYKHSSNPICQSSNISSTFREHDFMDIGHKDGDRLQGMYFKSPEGE